MQRAEFFIQLAVQIGVLDAARAAALLADYQQIQPPTMTVETWAARNRKIPVADGRKVVAAIGQTEFSCDACGAETPASKLAAPSPSVLVCPACGGAELSVIDAGDDDTSEGAEGLAAFDAAFDVASGGGLEAVSESKSKRSAAEVPLWMGDDSAADLPAIGVSKPTSVYLRDVMAEGATDAAPVAEPPAIDLPKLTMAELSEDAALWRTFLLEAASPDDLLGRLRSLRTNWKRSVQAGEIAGSDAERRAFERLLGVISLEALWQMPPATDASTEKVLEKIAQWLNFDVPRLKAALRERARMTYNPFPTEFLNRAALGF